MQYAEDIKARYLKENFNKKLGHLASDLARISASSTNSMNKKVVEDILEESKFFIEWVAPEVSYETQILLSEIQSNLALWQLRSQREKQNSIELKEIKISAKKWSERLINISGLL